MSHSIDRGPGTGLSLFLWHSALFVARLDMLSLALLLVCVAGFVAFAHRNPSHRLLGKLSYIRRILGPLAL